MKRVNLLASNYMKKTNFSEALQDILDKDPRYQEEAYHFVREALDYTIKILNKPADGVDRHVSGTELLDGIRRYALQEFGPITFTVLSKWGLHETKDFGHIVFNLVKSGILGKTDNDNIEDFVKGYDFKKAFLSPYVPEETSSAGPLNDGHEEQA